MSDTKLRITDDFICLHNSDNSEEVKGMHVVHTSYFCVNSKTFSLVRFLNDHYLNSNLCLTHSQPKSF